MKLNLSLKEEVIEKIHKVSPKDGEILIFKTKRNAGRYTQMQLADILKDILPDKNWIILDTDLEIKSLSEDQRKELVKLLTKDGTEE